MQKSMKAEMEMAMKLLEKDVHHKQDTIVCLRDQLEDIKDINLEMYTKLSVPTTLCLYCAQWEQRGIIILTWCVKNRVEYFSKIEEKFSYLPDCPNGPKSKIRVLKCVL